MPRRVFIVVSLGGLRSPGKRSKPRNMIYQLLLYFPSLVLDLMAGAGVAAEDKDLEIALLRQQLRVLERKTSARTRLSRPEKLMLVALADKLKGVSQHFRDRLGGCVLLVKPDTLLKWHRDLVRAKGA